MCADLTSVVYIGTSQEFGLEAELLGYLYVPVCDGRMAKIVNDGRILIVPASDIIPLNELPRCPDCNNGVIWSVYTRWLSEDDGNGNEVLVGYANEDVFTECWRCFGRGYLLMNRLTGV